MDSTKPQATKFVSEARSDSDAGRALNELSARAAEERAAAVDQQIEEWRRPKADRKQ